MAYLMALLFRVTVNRFPTGKQTVVARTGDTTKTLKTEKKASNLFSENVSFDRA